MSQGGVIFIDEAYALEPRTNSKGRDIFDLIMIYAENHRDKLTFILAGYKDDIEDELYKHNIGLKSRFPVEVVFDDFKEAELLQIWKLEVRSTVTRDDDGEEIPDTGWKASEAVSAVAARWLARGIGRKNFGNGREVRNLFQRAVTRAIRRGVVVSPLELETVDVIGDNPASATGELKEALDELGAKTGLEKVKEEIAKIVKVAGENYLVLEEGVGQPQELALNRLFLGNPGTGKVGPLPYLYLLFFILAIHDSHRIRHACIPDNDCKDLRESFKGTESLVGRIC